MIVWQGRGSISYAALTRRRYSHRRAFEVLWGGQFCPQPAFSRLWPPKRRLRPDWPPNEQTGPLPKIGKVGRFMRYVKIGALALALILFGTAVFLIVSDRMGQPAPPDPAGLIAKAARYRARIERDNRGVPHTLGPRDADVAF